MSSSRTVKTQIDNSTRSNTFTQDYSRTTTAICHADSRHRSSHQPQMLYSLYRWSVCAAHMSGGSSCLICNPLVKTYCCGRCHHYTVGIRRSAATSSFSVFFCKTDRSLTSFCAMILYQGPVPCERRRTGGGRRGVFHGHG